MPEDDEQGASARSEGVAKLVSTALGLLTLWVVLDPDGPSRLWYRLQLWLAYRNTINYGRLEGVRRRIEAGALLDDVTPTTTTIREVC